VPMARGNRADLGAQSSGARRVFRPMKRTIVLACAVSMAAACAKKEPAPPSVPPAAAPASPSANTPPRIRAAGGLLSGPGTVHPQKIKHVQPTYPAEARAARIQGTVRMRATINEQGRVVDIEVLKGPFELHEAAAHAVEQWEYTPGRMKGVPVATATELVVSFKLD